MLDKPQLATAEALLAQRRSKRFFGCIGLVAPIALLLNAPRQLGTYCILGEATGGDEAASIGCGYPAVKCEWTPACLQHVRIGQFDIRYRKRYNML